MDDPTRSMLRHAVAAVSYRAARVCENAPPNFAAVRASDSTRSAGAILAHMSDLFEWAMTLVAGSPGWNSVAALPWEQEVDRFFEALSRFDAALARDTPLACPAERLLQGPIADALTHVGQLAMLRRLAGAPQVGENYFKANIAVGSITRNLPAPVAPFVTK